MVQTEDAQQSEAKILTPALTDVLPNASEYMLELLRCRSKNRTEKDLILSAEAYKKELSLTSDLNADDIIVRIMLQQQSADAAKRLVSAEKSRKALKDIACALELNDKDLNALLCNFASPACAELFCEKHKEQTASIDEEQKEKFSKLIGKLLQRIEKSSSENERIFSENKEFISSLYRDKKLPARDCSDLAEYYCCDGAVELRPEFEKFFDKLQKENNNAALNYSLACKVMLYVLSQEDAESICGLDKAMPYRLLEEDLQVIAFKYLKLKSAKDAADTLDAVLKRLSCADSPIENLGLAVRVVCEANVESLHEAEEEASENRGKILFMRKLSSYKFFNGFEDELTSAFYGVNSIEEVISLFNHILRELPYNTDINENSDIGIKVLLKKLPMKDAAAQATFRKDNKSKYNSDALENEALNSYLGTKSRDEVLAAFKDRLNPYSFWRNDDTKHCYALNLALEEINGTTSTFWADTAFTMLEKGYPEDSVDTVMKGLALQKDLTREALLSAYEKFYSASKDHKDAAMRVVNMFQ